MLAQRAPSPVPTGLSPEVLSLACAPSVAHEVPRASLRVTGSQDSVVRYSFAPGDLIVINGGTDDDIEIGQEYFTRRAVPVERGRVAEAIRRRSTRQGGFASTPWTKSCRWLL